jgi:hypothetical protein
MKGVATEGKDRVFVGRVDGKGPVVSFLTVAAAENYIATYLTKFNPKGVERGDYYIDATEEDA